MKWIRTLAIFLAAALMLGVTASAVTVTVGQALTDKDGAVLGAAFVDKNGRTMVPLRAVADLLNLTVTWDGAKKTATFTDGETVAVFTQGANHFTADGRAVPMDAAVVNVDGRVYAPARYLAETFGVSIEWDASARTVILGETEVRWLLRAIDTTNSDGTQSTVRYGYDAQGNQRTTDYSDNSGWGYHESYAYDPRGNLLETRTAYSDGSISRIVCTYDENDRLLTNRCDDGSDWYSLEAYQYDANGNTLSSHYTDAGGWDLVTTYAYDAGNHLLKTSTHDANGNTSEETNTLDADGNVLASEFRSNDGEIRSDRYTYTNGVRTGFVSTTTYPDGTTAVTSNTYDAQGTLLASTYLNRGDGWSCSEDYTYDAHGNPETLAYQDTYNSYTERYLYDALERLVSTVHTENGVITTTSTTYPSSQTPSDNSTYDSHGNLRTEVYDDGYFSYTRAFGYFAITAPN
ncbi:MAG: copper amine oxidase N-terminal domain-containing protein [Oscillospiraceae bacterium]|nr:copper amine oxidase N-terminal domain-containing protein [Oscillospiraceae bacterium]